MTSANEMINQAAFDIEPGNTNSDKAVTVLVARAAIRLAKKEVFDDIVKFTETLKTGNNRAVANTILTIIKGKHGDFK